MEYVADRQEYVKLTRALRTPKFRETTGREEWPAMHRVPFDPAFANRWEDGDESTDIVLYADEQVGKLRKLYEFRNGAAVVEFLEENPFLTPLLFSAYDKVRRYFAGSRLVLKVIADPEAQEERELFVFIQTKLPPKAARPLFAEFEREWWLDAMLDARGEMNISLEYV